MIILDFIFFIQYGSLEQQNYGNIWDVINLSCNIIYHVGLTFLLMVGGSNPGCGIIVGGSFSSSQATGKGFSAEYAIYCKFKIY